MLFAKDDQWQKDFEDSFPYTETPDQQKAIDQVKHDMESAEPMDRLVCGDVGFGKTGRNSGRFQSSHGWQAGSDPGTNYYPVPATP